MKNLDTLLNVYAGDEKKVKNLEKRLIEETATQEELVVYIALTFFVVEKELNEVLFNDLLFVFFNNFYEEETLKSKSVKELVEGLLFTDFEKLKNSVSLLILLVGKALLENQEGEKND